MVTRDAVESALRKISQLLRVPRSILADLLLPSIQTMTVNSGVLTTILVERTHLPMVADH